MGKYKKNVIAQALFVMVDKTDMASVESGMDAADVKVRGFGIVQGASTAATAFSLAGAVSLVRSGLFRLKIPAATTSAYDNITFRFSSLSTVSCADQYIQIELDDYKTSDIYSLTAQVNSRVLLNISTLSDIDSALTSQYTKVYSAIQPSQLNSVIWNTAALAGSNVQSQVGKLASRITKAGATASILSKVYAHTTGASDILSKVNAFLTASNLASVVWQTNVDGASMASNIASQVWAHAIGARVDSRVLIAQSMVSDVDSALSSQFTILSSRVNKAVATASALTINSSRTTQANSRILLNTSTLSDIDSALSSQYTKVYSAVQPSQLNSVIWNTAAYGGSDVKSQVGKLISRIGKSVASKSALSHVRSMVVLGVPIQASDMSDLRSAILAGAAATVTASDINKIASHVWKHAASDANASNMISDIVSKVWAETYTPYKSTSASKFGALIQYNLQSLQSGVSDLYSAINATASASTVASAVWAEKFTAASNIGVSTFGSRLFKIGSRVTKQVASKSALSLVRSKLSLVDSALTSQFSQMNSRITKPVATASRLLLLESVASDAHSAAAQANSRIALTLSLASDIDSALSSQYTKSYSLIGVAKVQASQAHAGLDSQYIKEYSALQPSQLNSVIWNTAALAGSNVQSQVGKLASRTTKVVASASALSHVRSKLSLVDSAVSSQFTKIRSGLLSTLGASDVYSKMTKLASRITVPVGTQSKLGALQTAESSRYTILGSRVNKVMASKSALSLVRSKISLVDSALTKAYSAVMPSQLNSVMWLTAGYGGSDILSKMGKVTSRVGKSVASKSALSHLRSMIVLGVGADASTMSDLRSAITAGPAAADTTSIARAVWIYKYTDASVIKASMFGSRVQKLGSRITKAVANYSQLSDARSSINSHVSGITATVDKNAVASAVWANAIGSNVNSAVGKVASRVTKAAASASALSHVRSKLSLVDSAANSQYTILSSRVNKVVASKSALSHVRSKLSLVDSALTSQYTIVGSRVNKVVASKSALSRVRSKLSLVDSALTSQYTKVLSQATKASSRALVVQSIASGVDTSTRSQYTKAYSAIQAGGLTTSTISDIASAVWAQKYTAHAGAASTFGSAFRIAQSIISDIDSALSSQFTKTASSLSALNSQLDRQDSAFADSTSLVANGLKDRVRNMGWILRNKMKVVDATGDTQIYKDDNATKAFSVAGALTDDGVSTIRKRMI